MLLIYQCFYSSTKLYPHYFMQALLRVGSLAWRPSDVLVLELDTK